MATCIGVLVKRLLIAHSPRLRRIGLSLRTCEVEESLRELVSGKAVFARVCWRPVEREAFSRRFKARKRVHNAFT